MKPRDPALDDHRPSYLAAALGGVAIFVLYLVTLAPSTAMWDTSEYIAAAYTLGIPHPPGNPLFVLIGRVFSILPIASSVAVRINILAALCSALSATMWFLVTERVLVGWFPHRWQRVLTASLAVVVGGTAFTVWNQSVVNEKVYTVSLLGIAAVSWLMIRWSDDPDGRKADRLLVLVAYLLGLGYANHMAGFLAMPAVGLSVLIRRPRTALRWKLLLACAGAIVLGMTPFATQPIRAAFNPPINEGEPTACRQGLKLSCTFDKETWRAFKYNFDRIQYGKPPLDIRQAPFVAQVDMYWHYFKWQWLRDAHLEHPITQAVLAAVFLVLGMFGGWAHYQRDRRSFWYFGSLMFTMTLVLIYYLNFKYGASQSPELGDTVEREVRDRDYFFIWSFSAWGVWIALGLAFLWESVAALVDTKATPRAQNGLIVPSRRALLLASPVLLLAFVPLLNNWSTAPRRGQTYTRDFAHDILNSVEPYGVLVTAGDNDTFPLWYAQEVEGIRKDVVIANHELLNTDWHTRSLIRRPVYEYDAVRGPAIYRGKAWSKPSGPPLSLTISQADSLQPYYPISKPMLFAAGDVRAIIDPRNLIQDGRGNGYLTRGDLLVLQIVRDSYPDRPVYISRSTAGLARTLGFSDYTITQGLVSKVFAPPKAPTSDTMYVQGDGWLDVARSKSLWKEVYQAPEAFVKTGDWIDSPSIGIPYLYIFSGAELAQALQAGGDAKGASEVQTRAKAIAKTVRVDTQFGLFQSTDEKILAPSNDAPRSVPLNVSPPARSPAGGESRRQQ